MLSSGECQQAVGGETRGEQVRKHVEAGSALYTDDLNSCKGPGEFQHGVVDDAVQYVDGRIHTSGLENFWSLLKRGINGTYFSVEPFHLPFFE